MGANCCSEDQPQNGVMVEISPSSPLSDASEKSKANGEKEHTDEGKETPKKVAAVEEVPQAKSEPLKKSLPICEFVITLEKERLDDPLGMTLAKNDDTSLLTIEKPSGTAMDNWQKNNPSRKARSGDAIVAVNGVRGTPDERMEAIKASKLLQILLRRDTEISVNLTKRGSLGMQLNSSTLEVSQILKEGSLQDYNKSILPHRAIYEGDILVRINEVRVESSNWLQELQKIREGDKFTLVFMRDLVH